MNTGLNLNVNTVMQGKPNYNGMPHETMAEYLARGGKITKCRSNCCAEYPFKWARVTHPDNEFGQHLYRLKTGI